MQGERAERGPQRVHLEHVDRAQLGDDRAAVRDALDDAFFLELKQGQADVAAMGLKMLA